MPMQDRYPSKLLGDAVSAIGSLPGVGKRSALRLALHLLSQSPESVHRLTGAIDHLRDDVQYCRECGMISDDPICPICSDPKRIRTQICVVGTIRDVMSIEDTGQYNGLYHVLGGVISPIDGVGPSDLSIDALVGRVQALSGVEGAEVIFALPGDVEGETTQFYIYRRISAFGVKVTALARGLGFGDDLEYADTLTLGRSIASRQIFST